MISLDQGGGGWGYQPDNNFVANTRGSPPRSRHRSLRMRPCRVPLLGCFQAQHQHVEDDPDIDCDNQRANPVWPTQQVGHLERDVDGARSNGHPLRPGADVPQAVGLHEAKDHVDRRHDSDLPQAHVADPVHQVDEDSDVVVERIDVEQFQEALSDSPDIHVPHGEHTQAREDYDNPFCELNGGDSAHAFDVFGIVNYRMRDYRMRDFGMHVRPNIPNILRQSETGQAPSLPELFVDSHVCSRTAARNSSAISRAALWAASPWVTSKEIAPTRAWPPPP